MTTETIDTSPALVRRSGPVGIITLNRPNVLNAVNGALSAAVGRALQALDADPGVRACVITGSGRAFCAGADLTELADGRSFLAPDNPEWGFAGIVNHPIDIPVIAAVNGPAFGGGTEIVLTCDLAVISEDAALGLPEVKRGLFAGAGGVFRLPDQIPQKLAAEAILTGEPISASTALQWGLVNACVPADQVLDEAIRLAEKIAANAPLAVAASKRIMTRRRDFGSDWNEQMWQRNATEFEAVATSDDAREGARAFVEKRAPQWRGQ